MTRVICMCVTNEEDQINQRYWVHLNRIINSAVLHHSDRIHFSGFAGWLADTQKAVWIFDTANLATEQALHDSVALVVRDYEVPVTWAVLGPADPIRAASDLTF